MILDIVLIHLIIMIVWKRLDFPNEFASNAMRLITKGKIKSVELKKPFGCGLCMTFWITLIYMLIFYIDFGLLNIISVCLLSAILVDYSYNLLKLIEELFSTIISLVFKLIDYFTNK